MSIYRRALMLVSGASAAALITTGAAAPAWAETGAAGAAQAAQPGSLALTALSFTPSSIDATSGTATVTLTWTVTDSNASATDVAGAVYIRMAGSRPGSYIGMAYEGVYDLTGALTGDVQGNPTGAVQDASYSYTFDVPQYANAPTARWVVTKVTAQDDQGDALTLAGPHLARYHASLTATELVDATTPTYDSLMFATFDQRPYVYNNGVNGSMTYSLEVLHSESGFWRGSLTLQGPDGQTASGTFSIVYSPAEQLELCGEDFEPPGPVTDAQCTVTVTIPAGAAAGTWTVSTIRLVSNAGDVAVYRNLDALPITVTADQVVTASGFSASPDQVNNWGAFATSTLSMTVSGAVDGISAVYVDAPVGDCVQAGAATVTGDTVSVPMTIVQLVPSCTITGIAVLDGAGDLALYGSEYGAPSPGVTITQIPDTPPVITSASLSPSSVPASTSAQTVNLTVTIGNVIAPVQEVFAYLYDSAGNQIGGQDGSYQGLPVGSGPVSFSLTVPANLAPGVYTVDLQLFDVAGMETTYGPGPGGQPMPGGPLQLTVTSS
jgi:hypothetical protein